LAATFDEDDPKSNHPVPVIRRHKPPTFLQLQAQRRNVLRSTGPRTAEGKRRVALNSSKWRLASKAHQTVMALGGRSPFAYRRLHRQLIFWFAPQDAYARRMVADLAADWWDLFIPPRHRHESQPEGPTAVKGSPAGAWAANQRRRRAQHRVELGLGGLLGLLASRSRQWKYLLGTRLPQPIRKGETIIDLRRKLELNLKESGIVPETGRSTYMRHRRMNTAWNRV
jgi:hypothetical protein